jgi:hypothetical protein
MKINTPPRTTKRPGITNRKPNLGFSAIPLHIDAIGHIYIVPIPSVFLS